MPEGLKPHHALRLEAQRLRSLANRLDDMSHDERMEAVTELPPAFHVLQMQRAETMHAITALKRALWIPGK
jgi:hypothetical protein